MSAKVCRLCGGHVWSGNTTGICKECIAENKIIFRSQLNSETLKMIKRSIARVSSYS